MDEILKICKQETDAEDRGNVEHEGDTRPSLGLDDIVLV